jgi:hypothetical protein
MFNLPCLTRMFSGSAPARVDCTLSPAISNHVSNHVSNHATIALKDFVDNVQYTYVLYLLGVSSPRKKADQVSGVCLHRMCWLALTLLSLLSAVLSRLLKTKFGLLLKVDNIVHWLFVAVISVRRKVLCQGKKKVQEVMKKVQPQHGVRMEIYSIIAASLCNLAPTFDDVNQDFGNMHYIIIYHFIVTTCVISYTVHILNIL